MKGFALKLSHLRWLLDHSSEEMAQPLLEQLFPGLPGDQRLFALNSSLYKFVLSPENLPIFRITARKCSGRRPEFIPLWASGGRARSSFLGQ